MSASETTSSIDRNSADGVVAVGHAGRVALIEAATGRTVWERALANIDAASACDGAPVSIALHGATVLAGCMGHVFALDIADGALRWHIDRRRRGDGETSLAAAAPRDQD